MTPRRRDSDKSSPTITFRVPPDLLAEIDGIARAGVIPATRTAVILAALAAGLPALKRKVKR